MARAGNDIPYRAIGYQDADGVFVPISAANPMPASATLDTTGLATSAKQDNQITQETATATALGTTADASAAADNSTASLISLVKRLLARLTTLLPALGTTTDAAVITDANGTVQQYTRGNIVLTLLTNAVLGVTTGAAVVTDANGTIQQYLRGLVKLIGGTLTSRPADGVLTCTTSITRPADTNAYTANDALSDSTSAPTSGGFTFTSAARASGKSVILTDLLVLSSNNAATTLQGELYIFDTAVTNINDNAAFGFSDPELLTLVAKVPFTLVQGTNNSHHHVQNLNIGITTVGSANLWFLVKVLNAYTPASAEVVTVRAKFMPVD